VIILSVRVTHLINLIIKKIKPMKSKKFIIQTINTIIVCSLMSCQNSSNSNENNSSVQNTIISKNDLKTYEIEECPLWEKGEHSHMAYVCPMWCEKGESNTAGQCNECGMDLIPFDKIKHQHDEQNPNKK